MATRVRSGWTFVSAIAVAVIGAGCQASTTPNPGSASPAATSPSAPAANPSRGASPAPSASTPLATSGSSGWVSAGSTGVLRRDARAVRLSSGRVLVIGNGEASDGFLAPTSAELWDPATSTWTEIQDMSKVRSDAAVVALSGDRVLVAGGLNGESPAQSYSSAYIYDANPGQGTWSKTGLMGLARTGPSAAVLADGRVLVAGGFFYVEPDMGIDEDGPAPGAVLAAYHPARSGAPRSGPRLFDIDMGSAGAAIATAELFDPTTGTWTPTGPMHYARYGAPAVTLADGRVLVVGSKVDRDGYSIEVDPRASLTAEIYNPESGKWTLTDPLPAIDRAGLQAQGTPGANPMPEDDGEPSGPGTLIPTSSGAVLVGQTRWWKHLADLTRSFRFDAATGSWAEIGKTFVLVGEPTAVPLTTPDARNVSGALAAALGDGRVLVAGGGSNVNGFTERGSDIAEIYDPAADTWTATTPMPDRRSDGVAVSLSDGSVLVLGGLQDTGEEDMTLLTTAVRFVP